MKNTEKLIVGYDAENKNTDKKMIVGYDAESQKPVTPEQTANSDRAFLRAEEFGFEDKALRTANSRHYIGEKGERKAVITACPRHYYSEADKRMRRIDNTLELKNGGYENRYNGFKVRFAEDSSADNLMRVVKDGYEITFALAYNAAGPNGMLQSRRRACRAVLRGLKNCMPSETQSDALESGIGYPELYDGVDFEYEVKPDKIKENIKIAKRLDNYEFTFKVGVKGLKLTVNDESNTIEFYPETTSGENAEPIFTMPAAYMFDANGATSYDIEYRAEQIGGGEYLLTIIPSAEWLNTRERAFPVTVDPTVIVGGGDLIYKIVPDYSKRPSSSDFYRKEAGCQQIGYFEGRSDTPDKIFGETYLYFELKSATKSKMAHISNAQLDIPIYLSPYVRQANGYFSLYATNDSKWKNSSIDWKNNKPTTEYDIIGSAKPYKKEEDNRYHLVFDITSALRSGFTGFVIKGNHSNDFYNGGWQNSVYVPKEDSNANVTLSITYLEKGYLCGGKSISQSCNNAGKGSVDLFTGDLTYAVDILKLESAQLPLDISLVYKSNRNMLDEFNGFALGGGWLFSFMQSIKRIYKPSYSSFVGDDYFECYEYTDAYGNKQEIGTRYYRYRADGSKSYKAYWTYDGDTGAFSEISNDNYTLTKSGVNIVLTDKAGNKLTFTSGVLTSIEKPVSTVDNTTKIKMEITYGDQTITVKDSCGREAIFYFEIESHSYVFKDITYNGETICSMDDSGAIVTPYGKVYLSNDSNGYLKKITDSTGYTLEYKTQYANGKSKVTGYTIKSSVAEISYNADSSQGSVSGSAIKILEDVTIEYDSQITEGRLGGYGNMDNLTAVSNAAGAKTYYYFNSDGASLAVIDSKGNMEVSSARSIRYNDTKTSTVMQKTAQVLYSAGTAWYDPPNSHSAFSGNYVDEEDEITVVSDNYPQKGGFVFAVCLGGLVASGRINTFAEEEKKKVEGKEEEIKNIPYLALKVTKTIGGNNVEDFVQIDPCATGVSKKTMAFLPYFVEDNVTNVKVQIVTKSNPNFIYFYNWTVLRAAKGSSITVYDTNKSVTESYENGAFTETTTDITKQNNNTRITNTKRGTAGVQTTTVYYDSNKARYPERVVKEENQYLKRTYTYDEGGNVTSEEIQDLTTSKIMRRDYSYSKNGTKTALDYNALMSETNEDGNTYNYDYYTDTGYIKSKTFPSIREYVPGQDIDYAYSGIDGLLKKITTPARNDVGECENNFSYNLGYLTKLNHFGCEYRFKYDGFGRITEITVGGKLYSKTAYMDNGADIDGVTGATSKTVTVYSDGTYISVPYSGRNYCGQSEAKEPTTHAFASYYNKYGELIKVRYATDVTIDYTFKETEDYVSVEQLNTYNRCAAKYTIGTTVYEVDYDKTTGELIKRTEYENDNEKLKLEVTDHDGFGRVTGMKYSLDCMGSQIYKYAYKSDYDDRVKTVTLPNNKTETVTTDNFGRITNRKVNASSALEDRISYKTSKAQHGTTNSYTTPLISQMECWVGSTVKARYIYEYDVCGNITSISDNGILIASYEYDGLNRLIRENNVKNDTVTVYAYDNGGNLTSKRIYNYTTYKNTVTDSFLNISPNKSMSYSYNGDKLVSYNSTDTLTYDNFGNPRRWYKHGENNSGLRFGLSWSKVNRLAEITDMDSNERYEYTYDYNGIRTSKKAGNTLHKFYLDGSNIIAETRTVGSIVNKLKYYYGTMGLVGFNYNGTDYYYQKNVQGDIVRIYNNSGTLYGEYSYDAWGKCTIVTDINGIATINPFRYRGYYLDNETGLCYLNSRYYDPIVGRFLSPDSLDYLEPEELGGLNLYSYCNNNPVMYVDPSGTSALAIIGTIISLLVTLIIGAAISGLVGGFEAMANGDSFISGFAGGVVSGLITTVGLGFGLALGGVMGFIIVGLTGFLGGFFGSRVQQGISKGWDKGYDFDAAFMAGITTMITNLISYGFAYAIEKALGKVIGDSSVKLFNRIIEAMSLSVTGVATAIMCTMPISFLMMTVNLFANQMTKKRPKLKGVRRRI